MIKKVLFKLVLLASVSVFAFILVELGFRAGSSSNSFLHKPVKKINTYTHKLKNVVTEAFDITEPRDLSVSTEIIDTHLLSLKVMRKQVSLARNAKDRRYEHTGGALTSFASNVILIDPQGTFFAGESVDAMTELAITAPLIDTEAYLKAVEGLKFSKMRSMKTPFKYNDLKFYKNDVEQGLLLSYTEYDKSNECFRNVLSKLPFSFDLDAENLRSVAAKASDWQVLYKTTPCLALQVEGSWVAVGHMAGGALEFIAPSTIFMTTGDFHFDGMGYPSASLSDDMSVDYGKVLKIDLYSKESEIYASGLRNPQGLYLANDGSLFSTDHGPRGGDELNLIEANQDYGWPRESYGISYNGMPLPKSTLYGRHEKFTRPIFSWVPSLGISDLIVIDEFDEAWNGDVLVSSLVGKSIERVHLSAHTAMYRESIVIGERIRDVHLHKGSIWLWTDTMELIMLVPQALPSFDHLVSTYRKKQRLSDDQYSALRANLDTCQTCHSIIGNRHTAAPSLQRVYGNDIGSTSYKAYSQALKTQKGAWTRENLERFVLAPQSFAPGSYMSDMGLSEDEARHVVGFFEMIDGLD